MMAQAIHTYFFLLISYSKVKKIRKIQLMTINLKTQNLFFFFTAVHEENLEVIFDHWPKLGLNVEAEILILNGFYSNLLR